MIMFRICCCNKINTVLVLEATKKDIELDYDLTTEEGVKGANDELRVIFPKIKPEDLFTLLPK